MSIQEITNRQELILILQELNNPTSNEARTASEKILKKFTSNQKCLIALLSIVIEFPEPSLRQLAAIIIKNRIIDLWSKIDNQSRSQFKAQLLDIAIKERIRLVKISTAQIIAEIASIEIPTDAWKELAPFLFNCVKSEDSNQKELGMILFNNLLISSPKEILRLFDHMISIFQSGLEDKDEHVRLATVKASGALLNSISEPKQFTKFLSLISPIIKNLQYYVQNNDPHSELVDDIFSLLNDFVSIDEPEVEKAVPSLINYMVELICNTALDINLRDRASVVLGFTVKYNPTFAIKSKLVHNLLGVVLNIMTEPEPEDVDDDEVTAFGFASSILDEIAFDIPSKHTFKIIVEKSVEFINQPNPYTKKAGISALGLISEGCNELMKANLAKFIPLALQLFHDENKIVREASISAVINFVEFLIPDVLFYYKEIMPIIMKGFDDLHEEVKEKSCIALSTICNNNIKKHQIAPYLPEIMKKLLLILQSSQRDTQIAVIKAIAAISTVTEKDFYPYFDTIINIMKTVMDSNDQNSLGLRAKVIEATGIIAESVGLEKFGPFIQFFMNKALENFSLPEGFELAEQSFNFFGNIANILKDQFKPYLDTVVKISIQNIDSLQGNEIFEDDGEDVDTEFADTYELSVRTSELDEKGASILALGTIANAVQSDFAPYFDASLAVLTKYSEYPHAHIRRQVAITLKCVVSSIVPKPVGPEIQDKKLKHIVDTLIELYINIMNEDDDPETVARACESITSICKEIGIAAIKSNLKSIVSSIIKLLKKEGAANQSQLKEDDDEDHDIVLIDAVSDLIDELARCVGPQFVPHFKKIFPVLIKYLEHSAIDDRTMAIGTLAEVCKALGSSADPFVDDIFKFSIRSANEVHFNSKRNALFGLGVLAQNSPQKAIPYLEKIASIAVPVLQNGNELEAGLVDNSAGCISRLILYHTDRVPTAQLFPLVLKNLPLKEDFLENETVYNCITNLIETKNPVILNNFPAVLKALGEVLGSLNVADTIQQRNAEALKVLRASVGDENIRKALSTLDPQIAELISRAF